MIGIYPKVIAVKARTDNDTALIKIPERSIKTGLFRTTSQTQVVRRSNSGFKGRVLIVHIRFSISLIGTFIYLSLIHISEPTRRTPISYAVFYLNKKKL